MLYEKTGKYIPFFYKLNVELNTTNCLTEINIDINAFSRIFKSIVSLK